MGPMQFYLQWGASRICCAGRVGVCLWSPSNPLLRTENEVTSWRSQSAQNPLTPGPSLSGKHQVPALQDSSVIWFTLTSHRGFHALLQPRTLLPRACGNFCLHFLDCCSQYLHKSLPYFIDLTREAFFSFTFIYFMALTFTWHFIYLHGCLLSVSHLIQLKALYQKRTVAYFYCCIPITYMWHITDSQ